MAQSFTFRRGPVRAPETWTVHRNRLVSASGISIHFMAISKAHFSYIPQTHLAIADLFLASDTEQVHLKCNAKPGTESHLSFAKLLEAILMALQRENPSLMFTPKPSHQIAMRIGQVCGLLGVLFGAYFTLVNGILADDGFGIGMGVFMTLLWLFMIWAFNPGKPMPRTLRETMQHVVRVYSL